VADFDELLASIRRTAAAYGAEADRMATTDAEGAGRGQTDVVSVTVSGSGRLLRVETTASDVTPTRWRGQFTTAYEQALRSRTTTAAATLVPGVDAPRGRQGDPATSPEAEASRGADEQRIAAWAGVAERVPDVTESANADGVTVTVNGMLLVVDTSVTQTALTNSAADGAVLVAYEQACDAVQARLNHLVELTR
jgi:DNA-binding protein YbaB